LKNLEGVVGMSYNLQEELNMLKGGVHLGPGVELYYVGAYIQKIKGKEFATSIPAANLIERIINDPELGVVTPIAENFKYMNDKYLELLKYVIEHITEEDIEVLISIKEDSMDLVTAFPIDHLVSDLISRQSFVNQVLQLTATNDGFIDYFELTNDKVQTKIVGFIPYQTAIIKIRQTMLNHNVFDIQDSQLIDATTPSLDEEYDAVYCVPPFLKPSIYKEETSLIKELPIDFSRSRNSEWYFIARTLKHLSADGVGYVLTRNSLTQNLQDVAIRQELIEKQLIHSVIEFPPGLLNGASVATTLWILGKNDGDIRIVDLQGVLQLGDLRRNTVRKNADMLLQALADEKNTVLVSPNQVLQNDYILQKKYYEIDPAGILENPTPLKDLTTEIFRGAQTKKNEIEEASKEEQIGYLLQVSQMENGIIQTGMETVGHSIVEKYGRYQLKENDIVIVGKGTQFKAIIVEKLDRAVIPSTNLIVLRLDSSLVEPSYMLAFLNSPIGKQLMELNNTGTVIQSIQMAKLKEMLVPVPSIQEQQEVGNLMISKVDKVRYLQRELTKSEKDLKYVFNLEGGDK